MKLVKWKMEQLRLLRCIIFHLISSKEILSHSPWRQAFHNKTAIDRMRQVCFDEISFCHFGLN